MKKIYERPHAIVQEFSPNEYIAACYTMSCNISSTYNDGKVPQRDAKTIRSQGWTDYVWESKPHGSACGNSASYNDKTGTFYEAGKGSQIENVHIYDMTFAGGKSKATWQSIDINGTGTYNHYGYAYPADANRPNHS